MLPPKRHFSPFHIFLFFLSFAVLLSFAVIKFTQHASSNLAHIAETNDALTEDTSVLTDEEKIQLLGRLDATPLTVDVLTDAQKTKLLDSLEKQSINK